MSPWNVRGLLLPERCYALKFQESRVPVYPLAARNASCPSAGCWCHDRVRCYPSDLSDAQWLVLEPRARQVMAGLVRASGRPMDHDLRAMLDAVFYVVKNGIEWRALPADFPPWRRCTRSLTGGAAGACPRAWSAACRQRI